MLYTMHFDHLSDLPEWDDDKFNDEEEGEEWKPKPTKEACKAMYLQWQQVMMLLKGALDGIESKGDAALSGSFPNSYWDHYKQTIFGGGYEVAVKIKSSEVGLYTIRMENAAIIRKNAQYIHTALLTLMLENAVEESYITAIREEIDTFRELFKKWVATFEKDEFEDEWGLFV